jgi:S1-C subfamily serine protease
VLLAAFLVPQQARADGPKAVERIKPSIVAVGTFQSTRNPRFQFLGTGFAVGDGTLVATNAHVIPVTLNREQRETLAIAVPGKGAEVEVRAASVAASDRVYDLAVLRFDGTALPAARLGDGSRVAEGEQYLFTGFPLGAAIGLFPTTHQAMISAVTPIAIPQPDSRRLDARMLRRLGEGAYRILQLDATAYPGNSGSPLYDPQTAEVVGIINMVYVKASREAALSAPSGITYAVPVQPLKDLLLDIKQGAGRYPVSLLAAAEAPAGRRRGSGSPPATRRGPLQCWYSPPSRLRIDAYAIQREITGLSTVTLERLQTGLRIASECETGCGACGRKR